jgi:hypothetical protein
LAQRRLSPVQIVLAVAVILSGVLSMVPPFLRNLKASRLAEPLDRLGFIAARATALAAGRPVERAYPESAPQTPAAVPRGELVTDSPDTWEHPTWRELAFVIAEPHAYSFAFDSKNGPSGASFEATARGDLDGDGNLSTFVVTGEYKPSAAPSVGPMLMHRELE